MNAFVKEGIGTIQDTPCSAKTNELEDSDQREKWFRSFGKMLMLLVDKNSDKLVDNGDFEQIREYMIKHQVFSRKEVEIIEERDIRHKKMSKCLQYLVRKSPKVIEKFFVALKEADECLYDQLDWSFPTDEEKNEYCKGIQDHTGDDVQSITMNLHVELKLTIPQVVADTISQMSTRSAEENRKFSDSKVNDKIENEELQTDMQMRVLNFGDDLVWRDGNLQVLGHTRLHEACRKYSRFIEPNVNISLRRNEKEYNFPVTTFRDVIKSVMYILDKESGCFKINVAVGYLFNDPEKAGFKYFHPSRNCCVLSDDILVSDEVSLEHLLHLLNEADLFGENKLTTNFTFYVKCVENKLQDIDEKTIVITDSNSKRNNENKIPEKNAARRIRKAYTPFGGPYGNFSNGYQTTYKAIRQERYKSLCRDKKSHGGIVCIKAVLKELTDLMKAVYGKGMHQQ